MSEQIEAKRTTVKQHLYFFETSKIHGQSVEDVVTYLQGLPRSVEGKYKYILQLNAFSQGCVEVSLEVHREETDEEYADRLARRQDQRAFVESCERQQLARLKAKYGGANG